MTSTKRLAKIRTWVKIGRNDALAFGIRGQEGERPILGVTGAAYHNGYIKTLRKRTITMSETEVARLSAKSDLFHTKGEILRRHVIDQAAIDLIDKTIAAA